MKRRTPKTKGTPATRDQAWFERKVTELKTDLLKLPKARQDELTRTLERAPEPVN